MSKLVGICQAAIASGNRDFLAVYDGVFNVIKSGDVENYEAYGHAIETLQTRIKQGAEAKQRDEATDAATLLSDAARAKPAFDVVVRDLSGVTGARLELAVLGQADEKHGTVFTGLKKTARIVEKSSLRPGEGRGGSERVCDVVRAMLVASNMAAINSIVETIVALSTGVVEVVRIKDRFSPSAGGWRDLMLIFVVVGDERRHVCEVQVVHEMMLTARKGLPGHVIYGKVRNASELIESCGREHELRKAEVAAKRAAGATEAEVVEAFEDAQCQRRGAGRCGRWAGQLALKVKAGRRGGSSRWISLMAITAVELGKAVAAVVPFWRSDLLALVDNLADTNYIRRRGAGCVEGGGRQSSSPRQRENRQQGWTAMATLSLSRTSRVCARLPRPWRSTRC